MTLLLALALITALFIILLVVKAKTSWKFCAVCLAVSLTWLGLLSAYHIGVFDNAVILALLIGQSITGIYYLAEKRVPERLLVFRLPVLLALTFIFYATITLDFHWQAALLVLALWVSAYTLYLKRTNSKFKRTVEKIIACCGDW